MSHGRFIQTLVLLLVLEAAIVQPSFHHREMVARRRRPNGNGNGNGNGNENETEEECDPTFTCDFQSKYRTIDGKCNNIRNPLWGSSLRPFSRYQFPVYDDGVGEIRGEGQTSQGIRLPSPREVSTTISDVATRPATSTVALMAMQWGQFLDHDMVFTPEHEIDCCDDGTVNRKELRDPNCRPLDVEGDSFYDAFGVKCLLFTRSVESKCFTEHREQINELTSYIDGSQVYGSTPEVAEQLRSFSGGLLRAGEGEEVLDPQGSCPSVCPYQFLPLNEHPEEEGVDELIAGDVRVEEQPGLTTMHTIFFRAHNYIARKLGSKYNTADDEFLFQEARRIIGALIQFITYREFLPLVLGRAYLEEFNMLVPSDNYIYYPSVDATAPNVFATAAFRFGHTLINDTFVLENAAVELRESFFIHGVTEQVNQYPSDFARGLSSSQAQRFDHFLVRTLTNFLYAEEPFMHGSDLLSRNIMRARDHGIPPYNEWRRFCGLPTFTTFDDLRQVMSRDLADAFESVYEHVQDIDLFPALISENGAGEGGFTGPTLRCILGRHFFALKVGDRYWFENKAQPVPFTDEQLEALYQTRLSNIFCKFTNTEDWQRRAMRIPNDNNQIRDCDVLERNTVFDKLTELF